MSEIYEKVLVKVLLANKNNLGIDNIDDKIAMAFNKEKARKRIVKCVFLIYWLLIFEGALRKWVFPEYHQIIFFLRDPILLTAYFMAIRNRIITQDSLLTAGLIISIVFIALMFTQLIVLNANALTLIYGWRMYCFYLPLAFMIKDAFQYEDILKLIRQTLYISIPIAVLVYFQFISPPTSFINAAYGTGKIFVVTGKIVRTTGTFTFTAGQYMFVGSLISMLIFCWINRSRHLLLSMPWLLICTASTLTTLLLSGSRTAFFMTGLIVMTTVFGLFISRDVMLKLRGTVLIIFLFLVGTIMFLGPLSDSLDAISNRFNEAKNSEGSPFMRAVAPILLFSQHIITTPILGHGLGYGTNGGALLASGKLQQYTLAEDEWSRIIQESGPSFGLIYILYRITLTFYLAKLGINSIRNENNLLPIILLGFIGYYIFIGQITLTGTLHGFCWIFVGLIMAAAKKQQPQIMVQQKSERPYPNIVNAN